MAEVMSRGTLLEMAKAIEQKAQSFYAGLASKFKTYEKTFAKFSEDERVHAETYARLLTEKGALASERDREMAISHIKGLESMGTLQFLKTVAGASKVDDLRSAVELAQKLEQNTLMFYQNLLLYLAGEDRETVHKIIDVEYSHLLQLSRIDYFE